MFQMRQQTLGNIVLEKDTRQNGSNTCSFKEIFHTGKTQISLNMMFGAVWSEHVYGTEHKGFSYLDSVGDGKPGVCRGDLSVHQDHHQGRHADQRHADDIQTNREPTHGAAEQVEGRLVLV